ncbi:MAG: outer membrane lipoprotein carrier protein LolA [Bdellovibrionales bacterium]|nr:outer membrane lipoprotein carrier protein LolA [Bdellovibrionales bacterium]
MKKVEAKYSVSKFTQMKVTKTVQTALLNKTTKTDGQIWLSPPSQLRAEFGKDQLIVLGKKKIWVVTKPTDPDFDPKTRVMTSNNPNKLESPLLTAFLIGKGNLLSKFKISDFATKKSFPPTYVYKLVPKDKSEEIESIEINVNENFEITSMKITDPIQNLTTLDVEKTEFGKKVPSTYFTYTIPKGAEVTEF